MQPAVAHECSSHSGPSDREISGQSLIEAMSQLHDQSRPPATPVILVSIIQVPTMTTISHTRLLCLSLVSACLVSGCGSESPLKDRQKEFSYTADTLAEELIGRLSTMNARKPRPQRANPKAEEVSRLEADRGTDGDRPDPNSMEALVADAVAKARNAEEFGAGEHVLEDVLEKISASEQVPADVKAEFVAAVQAATADE